MKQKIAYNLDISFKTRITNLNKFFGKIKGGQNELRHTSGSWLGFSDILSDFRLSEIYTIYTCIWAKI